MNICTGGFRPRSRRALLLGAALILPATALPALAQDRAPAEEGAGNSNEILVTAQRRTERLEEVPMSVQVVSQETLSSIGVNTVRDLQNVTAGLQVGNSGSYPQVAIRGITTINAGTYENNVAVFVDDLYQFTPQILNMDLPTVDSIQVLKGPQGTLYGRNATGGAILINTKDPTDHFEGNIEGTYGSYNDRRVRGYVSGPLSDSIGVIVSGNLRHTDGFYKRLSPTTPGTFDGRGLGLRQEAIRVKLKAELSDSFRATLAYNYLHASDPRGVFFTATENVTTSPLRPAGLGEYAGDVFALDLKQHEGSLKLEWDTGIGTLRSITGYTAGNLVTTYDFDGSYAASSYSDSEIHDRTWQQSVDFNIDAIDRLDLVLGGNYYHITTGYAPGRANAAYLAPTGAAPGTPLSAYQLYQSIDFRRTKQAWALFIDGTYHLTDRLSITLGGRYSEETQDVAAEKSFYCRTAGGCAGGIPVGGVTSTLYTFAQSAQSSKYSKFTPRASIRYEIAPRTSIYFAYSEGFRSGEWNSVPPVDNEWAPGGPLGAWFNTGQVGQESVRAYEIGIKSAGRRLRFEAAAFHYDYSDLQLSSTAFVGTPPLAVVALQQVPKAKVWGVEASFDYAVTDNFNIRAGATWLHARYGEGAVWYGSGVNVFASTTGYAPNADPLKVFPNVTGIAPDISGLQMARAPNFSAYFGFDYNIPIREGGIRFAANVKYTDSYAVTEPGVWGGETVTSYQCKNGSLSGSACTGIPFVSTSYLPDNTILLAGSSYVGRASEQRARQPKFALLNASITWTDPTNHYYVRLWGNNLTDVTYRQHYRAGSTTYVPIGEPRTVGGTIGAKF